MADGFLALSIQELVKLESLAHEAIRCTLVAVGPWTNEDNARSAMRRAQEAQNEYRERLVGYLSAERMIEIVRNIREQQK